MSDSSYYEAGSGYESTVPGHFVPGPFPDMSNSGSTEGQGTSVLWEPARALSNSRGSEKKNVRSKFREEFGEVLPDPSPRSRIVSKLRVLSRQGHPPANDKRAEEVAPNHTFLSDCDLKDAQARRNMLYHGCPQAAGSAPEGWQQALYRGDLSTPGFYLGETQSVHDFEALSNDAWTVGSAASSGFHGAVETTPQLVPSPLRALHEMPRVAEDSLVVSEPRSYGESIGAPEHHPGGTTKVKPGEQRALHDRDAGSSDLGCSMSDDFGVTTGNFEPATAEQGSACGVTSARWPLSRISGNAGKPESTCLPLGPASLDTNEGQPQV